MDKITLERLIFMKKSLEEQILSARDIITYISYDHVAVLAIKHIIQGLQSSILEIAFLQEKELRS